MKLNDLAQEKSKLVVEAYTYALEHKLNIKSQIDVTTILKAVDPDHANPGEVIKFMQMLEAFDEMTKDELAKRGK